MSQLVIGCGYLGLRVALRLREAGEEVFATSRRPERFAEFSAHFLRPILCDVLRPNPLPEVEGVTYCVGFDRAAGASTRQIHVEGLAAVLDRLPGTPRFVYVSSTGVYGQADGGEVDETAATEPADESGRAVLEAERLLRRRRPDAVVLRFAGIYGPGRLLREASVRAGEPIAADPRKWLNLIHVEDGADVVAAALSKAEAGLTCNVSDGAPVRRRDFYAVLASLLGAPPPRFAPPAVPDAADRRVNNFRMRQAFSPSLRYPDYEAGLRASLGAG
jgi:nucleoside-diphosphate-sugar epimerase